MKQVENFAKMLRVSTCSLLLNVHIYITLYTQSYVKFILYKREVLIKLRFVGKIIGLQGGTLREY
mgnify:CR=1 FL=1